MDLSKLYRWLQSLVKSEIKQMPKQGLLRQLTPEELAQRAEDLASQGRANAMFRSNAAGEGARGGFSPSKMPRLEELRPFRGFDPYHVNSRDGLPALYDRAVEGKLPLETLTEENAGVRFPMNLNDLTPLSREGLASYLWKNIR